MYCCRIRRCFGTGGVIVLLVLALFSCESENSPATFYPIDSLITAQIKHLTTINAGLFKEALLDGKTDTVTYTPGDTSSWAQELDIFRELNDINKPVNKENYRVTDGLLDTQSNLKIKAFNCVEELPVVYLKVYYQGSIDKPRKIEALYDQGNRLFGSTRVLSMHFQQINNTTVLTSYSVKGGQKMILADSVAFYISGKIWID